MGTLIKIRNVCLFCIVFSGYWMKKSRVIWVFRQLFKKKWSSVFFLGVILKKWRYVVIPGICRKKLSYTIFSSIYSRQQVYFSHFCHDYLIDDCSKIRNKIYKTNFEKHVTYVVFPGNHKVEFLPKFYNIHVKRSYNSNHLYFATCSPSLTSPKNKQKMTQDAQTI